jgi:hypothetical protein
VVGLAVIIGIVGLQILDDSGGGSGNASVTTVAGATSPSDGTTTSTTPPRAPAEVRVKVYNASGVQGRAQTMTDTLRGKGYNMQDPETLDKQRQGTVIQCRTGFKREGQVLSYLHVPGSTVEGFPASPPNGADQADCLVVLGT